MYFEASLHCLKGGAQPAPPLQTECSHDRRRSPPICKHNVRMMGFSKNHRPQAATGFKATLHGFKKGGGGQPPSFANCSTFILRLLLCFLASLLSSLFASCLPSFLPSFIPFLLPSFLPSFLPFFLPSFLCFLLLPSFLFASLVFLILV